MNEPFEPYARYVEEYRAAHGGAMPPPNCEVAFREGYLRALREAGVRWRGDGMHRIRA